MNYLYLFIFGLFLPNITVALAYNSQSDELAMNIITGIIVLCGFLSIFFIVKNILKGIKELVKKSK